ncbi:putative arsenate reductase [Nostocoides japonicum T1-X7]|uniref:Putative arsenate reductase n=1 Tax=Nostocoides japonicum T1-X7 TaxID=1194083 RepID=A0A077M2U5_9MICO|nr:low molecular weight phosphatase family protein [Tetrasphaera japonica]CCH78530.1 putative arsenate reductase [Tetrasphaera japonica T1-X7]
MTTPPSVLFVCVKNAGKSQMAAALARHHAGDRLMVHSAGTRPGTTLNTETVAALNEIGATLDDEYPKPLEPALLDTVDAVIILGADAHLPHTGAAPVQRWDTDEPSQRGVTGMPRMRLIRNDIDQRVQALIHQLLAT